MSATLTIYTADREELAQLAEWLDGVEGVAVQQVSTPGAPNAQGLWDFLSVACGAGGPAVGLVQALRVWIESRATTVRMTVGDAEFVIRTPDHAAVLPIVTQAIDALPGTNAGPSTGTGGTPTA